MRCFASGYGDSFIHRAAVWAWVVGLLAWWGIAGGGAAQEIEPQPEVDAARLAEQGYQLLRTRCFSCHGAEVQEGGLRLDSQDRFQLGGDHGSLLSADATPGLLLQVLDGSHEDLGRMPPEGEGTPLDADEMKVVKAWVEQGAIYPRHAQQGVSVVTHWAWQPIVRPAIGQEAAGEWPIHPIDLFVQKTLNQQHVVPSAEAERATLVKRLYLDLTGLLPPPEVVQAFVESTDPSFYERLVDQLLASPHFGERWARHWLDAARYADSDGYEKDRPRPLAWRYREWVIDAINRDLSYRDFSIQQIAGDLLPDVGDDVAAATGFHRNTLHNTEGGTDPEEDRVKKTVDRTNTIGTLWLGMTVGCAQCHSHKYDPLTQREYYRLYAFFNQIDERNTAALLPRDFIDYERELERWQAQEATLLAARDSAAASVEQRFSEWLAEGPQFPLWQRFAPADVSAANGATFSLLEDGSWLAQGENRAADVYTVAWAVQENTQLGALRLEVLPDATLPKQGPGRADNGNFVLTDFQVQVVDVDGQVRELSLGRAAADFSQHDWQVEKSINEDLDDGWAISPQVGQRHVAVYEFSDLIDLKAGQTLRITLSQKYAGKSHNLGRFRLSFAGAAGFYPLDDVPSELSRLEVEQPERLAPENRTRLREFYRRWDPAWRAAQDELERWRRNAPKREAAQVQAVVERSAPRQTFVHLRGDFLSPGEPVSPGIPGAFPPLDGAISAPTRLDFGRWLFGPEHPTAARLEMNRVWLKLFGQGLVITSDDFGAQGEPPTHPELLDWLAAEFRDRGWSRKQMIRKIVTSATYRQSSVLRPELWERDPENKWLARQNRRRLEAETIRDAGLSASGLLDERVGGPSVRPPQPEGYSSLTYAGSATWDVSSGGDAYRRGLYIFFQRTSPYPMLMTFDCPDANQATVARDASNTPLQALTMLNERVFVEFHQALAQRLVREVPRDARLSDQDLIVRRIERAGWLTLSRRLTEHEISALTALFEQAQRLLREDVLQAEQLAGAPLSLDDTGGDPEPMIQRAAWVVVCRTLMNLDEFITRE